MSGITIKELREFLNKVPLEFDDCGMVNGEIIELPETGFHARLDKPIIHMEIDVENREFCLLHQSESEINNIIEEANKNGDSEDIKE